jgi:hypothetical protein
VNERSRQRPANDSGESAGALFLMAGRVCPQPLKPLCRASAEIRGVMRKRHNGLAKALQCALFIGAIAVCFVNVEKANPAGINDGIEHKRVAVCHYPPAIPRYMSWSVGQPIAISCPSPEVKEFVSPLHIENILRTQSGIWHVWSLPAGTGHFRPEHSGPRRSGGISIMEVERCRDGHVAKEPVSIELQSLGCSVTTVLPERAYPPMEMSSFWVRFIKCLNTASENECSFICDKRVFSELELSGRRSPERGGEGSYDYSGERGMEPLFLSMKSPVHSA